MRGRSGRVALAAVLAIGAAAGAQARERVAFEAAVAPGTIVVRTGERKLYLALGDGSAIRYPVAVGKPGKQWFGQARGRGGSAVGGSGVRGEKRGTCRGGTDERGSDGRPDVRDQRGWNGA